MCPLLFPTGETVQLEIIMERATVEQLQNKQRQMHLQYFYVCFIFSILSVVWPDLLCRAPRGGICDGPGCLLPCAELCHLQDGNERRQQTCIHHHLPRQRNIMCKNDQIHFTKINRLTLKKWSSTVSHTCICARFPAVMLEIVQQASFLMDSLGLLRRWSRDCSAEQFRITWATNHTVRNIPQMCGGTLSQTKFFPLTTVNVYMTRNQYNTQAWLLSEEVAEHCVCTYCYYLCLKVISSDYVPHSS